MSIVDSLERIRGWVEKTICSQVQLKCPNDEHANSAYPYRLVNPAAFAMYVPNADGLPNESPPTIPSVCIQLVAGKHKSNDGTMQIRMCFAAWDPALHGKDTFLPIDGKPGEYGQLSEDDAKKVFARSSEGWKDAWNFVDVAVREIESTETISGMRVVIEDGVTFGPATEQEAIVDFYPYWFAWVNFTLYHGITRSIPSHNEFL